MDYDAAKFYYEVLNGVFMVGVTIYVWWSNRTKATKEAISNVEEKLLDAERTNTKELNAVVRRLDNLEEQVKHLPDHDDLGDIHEKVNQVASTMSEVRGELVGINRTLGLINEFLLNKGSK